MTKCAMCSSTKAKQSGCFVYCDKCDARYFVTTAEYLGSSAQLMGDLLSNTAFPTEEAMHKAFYTMMEHHLPNVTIFMSVANDRARQKFLDTCLDNAINVVVADQPYSKPEVDDSLKCSCGETDRFIPVEGKLWNHLECCSCGAEYYSDDTTNGRYEPYFSCGCGSVTYEPILGKSIFTVKCTACPTTYWHDQEFGGFKKMGGN